MAEASFEVGYVNIETIETSNHPEIEATDNNLQIIEATTKSNEVHNFEKKECDNIVEQNCANKIEKPKSLALKRIDEGLRKTANDSDWYNALDKEDCKTLMSLLQENPCLVAQTNARGWTILHAAAHNGCLPLLHQVFDLFKDNDQFMDEMSGVRVHLFDLLVAKCDEIEAEAHHMAWFTCPREIWQVLKWGPTAVKDFQSWRQRSSSDASQHLKDKLVEIMQGETTNKAFEPLKEEYESDWNYSFETLERKTLLRFHYACQYLCFQEQENYVETVIHGCMDLGPSKSVEVLTYLLKLHNAQGQTPFHVALRGLGAPQSIPKLLTLLREGNVDYGKCLNAKDVRGWTVLHLAAATKDHDGLNALLKEEQIDANARTRSTLSFIWDDEPIEIGTTALHLAILHNDVRSVELLLQCPYTDVNALFKRYIVCGYERIKPGDDYNEIFERRSYWSPLQLAAIMGLSDVVRALLALKPHDIYDVGKFQNNITVGKNFRRISALLLASASGKPDILRLFLDNPMFDPLVKSEEGATTLHYATNAMIPTPKVRGDFMVDRFVHFSNLGELDTSTCRYKEEIEHIQFTYREYLGRQACITMLLQAGVDIWEKDNQGRFVEPGPQAPEEAHLWWHEKMAQETLEAKKSLNDAANAISVVAALVATTSFVGPLQPPLGYGGDSMEGGVQDTHLSIRVFMVSNNLSFYLAVASILFAVVPSLPMPQEGIYTEWQRTRRTVGVAIFFLLMSVLGVLISFGAASNSVVSEDYSWRHDGLLFYPTLLGGLICILGISLLFLRLLRLVFNRNAKIRYLYKTFGKL